MFASPVYIAGERPRGGRGEAAYWLPLIALFSGARRTEIAQLRIGDLRQSSEGIWFIDITNRGEGQSLKNVGSARSVPVHAELIRLGILDYHRARTTATVADSALWVGFHMPVEPKAKAWSKWFARYLGTHVVESRAKTFHSFRHTFKRGCREAGLPEEYHNAMTGHSGGNVGRSYGRQRRDDGSLDCGIPMSRLKTEIDKVAFACTLPTPSKDGADKEAL